MVASDKEEERARSRRTSASGAGVRRAFALLALVGLTACERGCLRRRATELLTPNPGGQLPQARGELPLTAACPEDLARCVAGRVRAAGRLAPDVRCSPEGCPCPWDDLGACPAPGACLVEGLELDVPRERAVGQLCAPKPGASFALMVPLGSLARDAGEGSRAQRDAGAADDDDVDVACDIEQYRCDRGVVFACQALADRSPRAGSAPLATSVARCLNDCAVEGGTVMQPVSVAEATALLCRR